MDSKEILKKLDKIKELPTLPVIAMEVNKMLQNPSTSIESLSTTIEKDQAIVSKMLKLVNSAFYGARSRVSTVNEAVIRLGFNSVRNIVISVSIIDSFSDNNKCGFNLEDFWKHSIGVALTSKYLADKTGLQDPDDCFVCGLLHDIGYVILAQHFSELFSGILALAKKHKITFYEVEKKAIPLRHPKIGEYLTKRWQLPVSLCDTVKYHHQPSKGAVNPEQATIVHLGDIIINKFAVDSIHLVKSNEKPNFMSINYNAEKALERQYRYAEDWFPGLYEKINEAWQFFFKARN